MSKPHAIEDRVCKVQRDNPDMSASDLAERFGVATRRINRIAQRHGLTLPNGNWAYTYQPNKRR